MNHNKKHGAFHGLLMLICCLAPILLLVLFAPQLKSFAASGGTNLYWLFLLLCPIMHIGMMFFMKDKGGSCHGNGSETKKIKESETLQNEQ